MPELAQSIPMAASKIKSAREDMDAQKDLLKHLVAFVTVLISTPEERLTPADQQAVSDGGPA